MILKRCSLLLVLSIVVGCSSSPALLEKEGGEPSSNVISISMLQSMRGERAKQISKDVCIRGRVVSSDLYENLYKELYIQDETGGVVICIDNEDLFADYVRGHEIEVRCNSLYINSMRGVCALGVDGGLYDVLPIPNNRMASHVKVTDGNINFAPFTVDITNISHQYLGCWIELSMVQFIEQELGLAWCNPEQNTVRHLEDENGYTIDVYTDNRAFFANTMLPRGRGYVRGVLSLLQNKYCLIVCGVEDTALMLPRF